MTVDTLKTVFTLEDQYTAAAGRATSATKNLSNAFGDGGGSGLAGAASFALAELDSGTPILGEIVSVLKTATIAAAGLGVALVGMSVYAMKTAGDVEALRLGLQVYAGSAEETDRVLRRLREVAKLPGLGFREAIQGSIRLQAVGADARLAERALMAFGNAIASSGGGKEELDGVLLALSQIVSKGAVSAEEINQIAERVPQIRKVMLETFGTATGEDIQKLGITAEEFVMRTIAAFEKLPPAAAGAKNAFENVGDVADRIIVQIGDALNAALLPALKQVSDLFDFLEEKRIFGAIVTDLLKATNNTSAFGNALKNALGTATEIAGVTGSIFEGPIGFLSESEDFGDALVRASVIAVSVLSKIPGIFDAAMVILDERMAQVRKFVNDVIGLVNSIINSLKQGLNADIRIGWPLSIPLGRIGADLPGAARIRPLERLDEAPQATGLTPGQKKMADALNDATKFGHALYDEFKNRDRTNALAGDTSTGGFIGRTASATERTAKATEQIRDRFDSLREQLFGTGAARAAEAVSARNVGRITGRGITGDPDFDQGLESIARAFANLQGMVAVSTRRPHRGTR